MGPGKLSGMIKVTYQAATKLIEDYFRVFPKIKGLLDSLGRFGVENGYIMTLAPFFRKRWFPYWRFSQGSIRLHLSGQYDAQLGKIEREAKNMPIQGAGGDMCKLAVVLCYERIHEQHYPVKLRMQVHDQIDTTSDPEFAWQWSQEMDELMREAAQVIIPNGLLGADVQITPVWTK
jgi:DNA polymerase-1